METELCALQIIYTCRPVDAENGIQIGAFRCDLGSKLAEQIATKLPDDIDYVVPIPNSGLYYAMGFAERSRIPYLQFLVKADNELRSLFETDSDIRAKQIRDNIVCVLPKNLKGKNLLLIDEAIFTGTTLKCVCEALREQGAGKIYAAIPTGKVMHCCKHMPQKQLLAPRMSEDEMREYLGLDGLWFQDEDIFISETLHFGNVCTNCFKK